MRGQSFLLPPALHFQLCRKTLAAGGLPPTPVWQEPPSKGRRPAALSCPLLRAHEEPSHGCPSFSHSTTTDILQRENTSLLGFFSFIIGIS